MKLPASDKTSAFTKPHIRKGYYPAQLLKVEEFKDKDGNAVEGKYGRQLIFEFGIYAADPESGAPTQPMTHTEGNMTSDVLISKFVYHQYKDKKTNELQTAITPNSAITKLLKALGWEFSAEGVDIDALLNAWVEVNIDDYEYGDDKQVASTIKDVNPYKGPKVGSDLKPVTKKEPTKVAKQVKHEAVKEEKVEEPGPKKIVFNEARQKKADEFKKMLDEKMVTQGGYDKMIESLEAEQASDK